MIFFHFFVKKWSKKLPENKDINIVDGVPILDMSAPLAFFEKKQAKKLSANIDQNIIGGVSV